jgi:predicted enzyme related to lactoylglutathione lyase
VSVLVEFPADDPGRARAFWEAVLGVDLRERLPHEGSGHQADLAPGATVGVHARGRGPGDRFALPYLPVDDLPAALARVREHGGEVVHGGERWAVCRDSEGTPFGLAGPPPP